MKRLFFTLILFIGPLLLWAQNSSGIDRRVVYLWDVTYSMHGGWYAKSGDGKVMIAGKEYTITKYSEKHDIYDKVLESLITSIKKEDPNTELVVIPFGSEVLEEWTYRATDDGKAALERHIRSFCELGDMVQATNIGGGLQYVKDHVFEASVPNTLVLLTDGVENVDEERFYRILDTWCDFCKERNVQGYYFALTNEAINPNLKTRLSNNCLKVIDANNYNPEKGFALSTSEFEIIGPNQVVLEEKNFNNSQINLEVSVFDSRAIQGSVKIKVTSEPNNYISVDSEISIDSQTRTVSLPITYKQSLPDLKRTMTTDEKGTPITLKLEQVSGTDKNSLRTQELTFNIINKKQKTLQIEIVK